MSKKIPADLANRIQSVVIFEMGDERLAVPTDILREVLEPPQITRVPCADNFSAGLANVRGVVLPVVDMRPMFNIEQRDFTRETRVLILETTHAEAPLTVGVIADRVHAIVSLDADTIRPVPPVGSRWPNGTLYALARWEGDFVALPDMEYIFETQLAAPAVA